MDDVVIQANGLSKQYRIGAKLDGYKTLRETLTDGFVAPFRRTMRLLRGQASSAAEMDEKIWALKDVSFEIRRGEVVGIIGRNGAGKTTLLKILSRITEPTEGCAEIRGRIGSLLEVGTGFHPELTGRENIYLNGAILGMKKRHMDLKFDEIVAFGEIEKFIDTPVKHYSSGMYVRLAFAVAAHLEPEILLVDEVLAVGDAAFQKKCLGKMGEVAKEGRTVLFVSHNMAAIESLCSMALFIKSGRLKRIGPVAQVISAYLYKPSDRRDLLSTAADRSGSGKARLRSILYRNHADQIVKTVRCGDCLKIQINYAVFKPLVAPVLRMTLCNTRAWPVAHFDSEVSGIEFRDFNTHGRIVCKIDSLNLSPGEYYLNVGIKDAMGLVDHVLAEAPLTVEVSNFWGSGKSLDSRTGLVVFRPEWRLESEGEN